ncbi:PREDICTED: cadherin-9 [Calidris pugnax]|uniref:cadherin-9 n=1 Tax=Calidris pugnax TaxID=198806 RepID=UPI00071DB822|nr:PREDICTED: cadherin-9 [Calidris pugnax]XP_014796487.1 PREDICTED: cadherin-9 [Calidris pugnax]XP_014796488.1 PREDICTED: cadherin-9 [Calidris pugnax]
MMRTYSLTVLLWSCMFHAIHMMSPEKRTNKHSHSESITGLSENDGKTLHRTKRGWMWNQFFLLEEYTGPDTQYVGKLHTDQDKGDGNLKYILTGDGAGSLFIIDENTGDIHAAKKLDREEKSLYVLRAKAIDRKTGRQVEPESEFIIKIHDINDNEPKFTKDMYTASIPEMTGVGTSVIQVTATDADDANYGNSAKVVYSILQGQPYFSVDPETGIIKTALPDMSRENREQYQVVIQAKDMGGQMGGLSGTTTVNITLTDVNDNPPRFPQSTYQFSSPESAPPGTPLGRIKANDPDVGENAEIEYSISNGDGSDMFDIVTDKDTQEGIITVKKHLDFESKMLYTLRVEAINTHPDPRFLQLGPFKDTALVKISVEDIDEPPVFSRPWYLIEVDEDAKEGSIIGQVEAQDPDVTKKAIKYSVDRHTDLDRIFNIYSGNGSLFISKPLDREETPWHNITVIATEINNPKQTSQIPVFIKILDINDHAPEFAKYYETFVCENAKAGQLIQTVSAVDKDEPPRGHKFFFELVPEFALHPNFSIVDNKDNTAGIMTRRNGYSRSKMSTYLLPIIIFDNDYPIQSSTGTLTIRVCACDSRGNMQSCSAEALLLPAGLSTGALVAILLCIIILLVLVVLFTALKRQRKKEPLIISKDDVRDNIVTYNDEGGGEEDTQAFDIGALRNPEAREESKMRRDVIPETIFQIRRTAPVWENIDVQDFIHRRLKENDLDPAAPPYDSLATYAYEGNDSIANSLSSLESLTTECNQDYDYLSDWGPRFKKLADMYGGEDSDRD